MHLIIKAYKKKTMWFRVAEKYCHFYQKSQCPNRGTFCESVWSWPTHIKRTIPVLDIAKANPRIPLPMIALLRLKTDMPNEVFPSNCKRVRQRRFPIKIWIVASSSKSQKVPARMQHSRQWSGFLSSRRFCAAGTLRARPCYPPRQSCNRGENVNICGRRVAFQPRSFWISFVVPVVLAVSVHLLELHCDCWGRLLGATAAGLNLYLAGDEYKHGASIHNMHPLFLLWQKRSDFTANIVGCFLCVPYVTFQPCSRCDLVFTLEK